MMYQLTIQAACSYVRKVLDELTSVEDIGMMVSPDSLDLHRLTEGFIVEAAVRVHSKAPVVMLDGRMGVKDEDYNATPEQDGSITITMLKETIRLASLQVGDSPILTGVIPEDSAEGRMQKNAYVCGTHDDPRLVLAKRDNGPHKPVFRYYSVGDKDDQVSLEYVPYPVIEESVVCICPQLEYAVLNEVVSMVLDSLGESDRSALYKSKVEEYLNRQ